MSKSIALAVCVALFFVACVADEEYEIARKAGEERLYTLKTRSAQRPLITVNSNDFRRFVQDCPRPYDLVVFLTSKSGSCQMCNEMRPELEMVAEVYEKARYVNASDDTATHSLFFVELDGSRNYELFTELGLQTVPHLVFLERTTSSKKKKWDRLLSDRISFSRGWAAENMLKSLGSRSTVKVHFERPPKPIDWSFLLLLVSSIALFIAFFTTVGRPYIDTVLRNRKVYLGISLFGYAFCVAGGMYNHIQGVPFNGQNNDGTVQLISGNGSQYGVETYIMGFLYLVSASCIIILNTRATKLQSSYMTRVVTILALLLCFHFFFRQIREIYTRKNGGYRMGYLWSAPMELW